MNYEIIKTGSKGNATIIENKFLLDCGVSYKLIEPYLKSIKLIFISHSHKDHLLPSTVKKIAYEYPNIKFLVGEELVKNLVDCEVQKKNIFTVELGKWYNIGLCKVKLDYLYHDVPNYCLHLEYNNQRLIYCTDTSRISHVLAKDYQLYLIEANYLTNDELDAKIIEAKQNGEFTYLERVKHTHLSQLDAINWLDNNKGENSKYIFIHQHEERK